MAHLSFDLGVPLPLEPRQWQSRLIQLLRTRMAQPCANGHDVLVHAGPGAGKTLGALLGVWRLLQEGRLQNFVVFCHRTAIASQWLKAAERLGLALLDGAEPGVAAVPPGTGLLLSYQAAALQQDRLESLLQSWGETPWLAIADEAHHLGIDPLEPESAAWGLAFTTLTGSARLRLGLSGTPFRADQLGFCAARREQVRDSNGISERIVPDLCVEPRQLIDAGDVRPLEFRFQDGWIDHSRSDDDPQRSSLSGEERESWRARNLRRAIRLGDGHGIALRVLLGARRQLERVREQDRTAGGLVIARDIAHARQITQLLLEQGDAVQLVHSLDQEAPQRLLDFQQGRGDWLVSIDMCSEGFDAPRLRVVAYLSTVITRSRFVQAITRAVRLDSTRGEHEPIPRLPSYVYAPADPLLISHARSWSISEPYLLRSAAAGETNAPGWLGRGGVQQPLTTVGDEAAGLIAVRGPQLPAFVSKVQQQRSA